MRNEGRRCHWRKGFDLAVIRDKDALAKLPAEERAARERLWADAAALLKKGRRGQGVKSTP